MVRQGVLGLLPPGQVVKVEMPHDILVLGGGGGGHYNRGNKGGDGGSGVVIIKYLRSLGRTTFSPTNTNNISSRKETKHSLNRSLIFHIDPSHPKPHEIAHILLVAGGGGGGMDMGGGGGGGGGNLLHILSNKLFNRSITNFNWWRWWNNRPICSKSTARR